MKTTIVLFGMAYLVIAAILFILQQPWYSYLLIFPALAFTFVVTSAMSRVEATGDGRHCGHYCPTASVNDCQQKTKAENFEECKGVALYHRQGRT